MSLSFTRVDDYGVVTDSARGVILKTKALGTPYSANAENIVVYFADISFTLGILVADITTIGGVTPANAGEAVSLLAPIFAGSTPTVKVIVSGDCN
jgi:hypothetical protein